MSEKEFLEAARQAAYKAGEVLQSWMERFTVSEKSPANLVTEADLAAEQAIHQVLQARFPDHNFLGEEELQQTGRRSRYRWIIDPLDGTSNYVHGFPYYAVSIALQRAGELVVGVIFDPTRNEMFSATRGQGAFRNDRPIRPSRVESLEDAMVVASLPVHCSRDHPAVERFLRVMPKVQTLQRTGSAALNLAYVACGRIEAFWSFSLKPWDMAAGALLVAEAGGLVSKSDGSPFDVEVNDILCSNGAAVHRQLQQFLS